MRKIVECVPNFSEGRDLRKIKMISDAINETPGVKVIHVDPGAATNRTVITFVGSPQGVKEAAFRSVSMAQQVIDMEKHHGEHPRMGAADVFPFIPVSGVTMDECIRISRDVGERIGRELGIPVYLYESSATVPERRSLAYLRSGEYEGFKEKILKDEWKPDFGPQKFNPRSGCTTMGAREFLIAYNVNIESKDKEKAQRIAERIRESGVAKRDAEGNIIRDENGKAIRTHGLLKNVRAVGWYIEEYGKAQISINMTNFNVTPLHEVFDTCESVAEELGTKVTGSEMIGLVPKKAILEAGRHYLNKQNKFTVVPEGNLIDLARGSMGLDEVGEFVPEKKIIEFLLNKPKPLGNLPLKHFINEVCVDSPSPGGGSVAALSGSLAAALASMVGNLTGNSGKIRKKPVEVQEYFRKYTLEIQKTMEVLKIMIDEDSQAFMSVMDAVRMPKVTEEEKRKRLFAINEGYKLAATVPLEVMKKCVEIMPMIRFMAQEGLVDTMSDIAVSVLMAQAGIRGAAYNVQINLGSITDDDFSINTARETTSLLELCDSSVEEILEIVKNRI
ncbi:MAG: glutamate formimidoyltransferase [Candidatus Thermoplasmatota archaeon]|jgi:glutamate formiminotransferase/formiminotetrahydrofolate cyclodeaminase|nr:glutamate formimidoyltransferase [Candidatus Thermoplasmatota archaeon]